MSRSEIQLWIATLWSWSLATVFGFMKFSMDGEIANLLIPGIIMGVLLFIWLLRIVYLAGRSRE